MRCIDTSGVPEAGLKVVIDTAGGTAALVLPTLLGRIGIDVLTVNNRLDETSPTETVAEHMRALERLGELVASSRAAFGVRFDPVGERISLVDERGVIVHDDRALLVLDGPRRSRAALGQHRDADHDDPHCRGRRAVPSRDRRAGLRRLPTSSPKRPASRTPSSPATAEVAIVIPEFNTAIDGIAAFVRLTGLVARTKLTLSQIDARIPQAHVLRRSVPTPWAAKGMVMRSVVEAAGDRELDTTDGVRVVEDDGRWVLVLPDPAEATTHLWAEGTDADSANDLLEEWASCGRGGRQLTHAQLTRAASQLGVPTPRCIDVRCLDVLL